MAITNVIELVMLTTAFFAFVTTMACAQMAFSRPATADASAAIPNRRKRRPF